MFGVSQASLSLTKFKENSIIIYISKYIYYENIFNDSPNDTSNYIP